MAPTQKSTPHRYPRDERTEHDRADRAKESRRRWRAGRENEVRSPMFQRRAARDSRARSKRRHLIVHVQQADEPLGEVRWGERDTIPGSSSLNTTTPIPRRARDTRNCPSRRSTSQSRRPIHFVPRSLRIAAWLRRRPPRQPVATRIVLSCCSLSSRGPAKGHFGSPAPVRPLLPGLPEAATVNWHDCRSDGNGVPGWASGLEDWVRRVIESDTVESTRADRCRPHRGPRQRPPRRHGFGSV